VALSAAREPCFESYEATARTLVVPRVLTFIDFLFSKSYKLVVSPLLFVLPFFLALSGFLVATLVLALPVLFLLPGCLVACFSLTMCFLLLLPHRPEMLCRFLGATHRALALSGIIDTVRGTMPRHAHLRRL
jgi:hypothetical protein